MSLSPVANPVTLQRSRFAGKCPSQKDAPSQSRRKATFRTPGNDRRSRCRSIPGSDGSPRIEHVHRFTRAVSVGNRESSYRRQPPSHGPPRASCLTSLRVPETPRHTRSRSPIVAPVTAIRSVSSRSRVNASPGGSGDNQSIDRRTCVAPCSEVPTQRAPPHEAGCSSERSNITMAKSLPCVRN